MSEVDLNPAQREAAEARDGAYLVVAGAGSGKTRTLVHRVASLVESGVRPESVLLLTFTRRAAQEMLRRAAGLLDERCRRVAGGTYHSFANVILRRYADRLGYGESFTILDRSDAADLVGVLRSEGGYDRRGRRFPRKDTLLDLYSKRVNTQRPIEDLLEESYPQFSEELEAILELGEQYTTRKKAQNVMDYDDLLTNLRDLLKEHSEVRRKLSKTYRYVMVDEYQDTNRLQAHISVLLAVAHGNIMVVGDDAQSIYSFRGAEVRNIMDFPALFKDCKTILLEQNYRSIQPILDLGNAILDVAKEKYSKTLHTELQGDQLPIFLRTVHAADQADFIARRVLELREEGVPLAEIAVLSRAAWHTNALEVELGHRNIPFRKFGGIKFVEAAHVKDVCALLKLSRNPTDGPAWLRSLQLLEGIGPKTAREVTTAMVETGGDLDQLLHPRFQNKRYSEELGNLRDLLSTAGDETLSVGERLAEVLATYERWMPKKYDDLQRRLRDLEAVRLLAERSDDLDAFLTEIAIDPPEVARDGGEDEEDEWITLSTIHSAKGLEWHTVFIVHLNLGQFPNYNSLREDATYEEERRLLYVAVTRAKQNLYLIKPEEAGRPYAPEIGEVSPLLTDIRDFESLTEEITWTPPTEEGDAGLEEETPESAELLDRIEDYFG